MNLAVMTRLAREFAVPVGLSDHTLAPAVAVAAVAMGACIVEKHFIMARSEGGPDASFSLEPAELRELVSAIRTVERARGTGEVGLTAGERGNRIFRPSLYVTADVRAGDVFSDKNVRSVRPAFGLAPRFAAHVLGKRATRDARRGTPLAWELIEGGAPDE
jgi:N-acetylneuraminate synthase